MTIITRSITLLLLFFTTAGTMAQRWDNYRPDNRRVALDSTNLPILFIDTDGQMIDREERITARMKIIWNGDGQVNYRDTLRHPGQNIDYDGYIGLKYRGNSSFDSSDKKPYSIKLLETPLEQGGAKRKEPLLGMGKDNDWALLAPYSDRSMIRDVLAFTLAKPYFDYTPTARHCELVLDNIYYGVFVLTERVTKGKRRLNLDDPGDSGDALTGGYQVQIDRDNEPHIYLSKHHPTSEWGEISWKYIHYQYKHPEFEEMSYQQRRYLQGRIDAMENALASAHYKDATTGYRRYLDVTSFIDYQLSTEIANNIDDVITDGVVVLHGNTDIEEIFVNPELVLKSGHCIGAYQCVCYPDMGNVVYNHPLDMCGNYNMCRVGGGIYNPRMAGESDYVYLQLQVSGECDPGEAVPQLEIGYDET